MGDATAIFSIHDKKDYEIHEIVQQVYDALKEKGWGLYAARSPYLASGQASGQGSAGAGDAH